MSEKTIFKRIIDGEIPADILHDDEHCLAFRDVQPQAPTHILVIPKKEIAMLNDAQPEDAPLLGHLLDTVRRLAKDFGLEKGYRVVINNGAEAGQSVFHLHVHLLAGRPMKWPPG